MLKHIQSETILQLKDEISVQEGQVVSKTLSQNEALSLTLFSFDVNEEISTHRSEGDALVTILSGTARTTIDNTPFVLSEGQTILMPAQKPHAVFAETAMKMMLLVVF